MKALPKPAAGHARRAFFALLVLVGVSFAAPADERGAPVADDAAPLFHPVYGVLTHPRCVNCHTITEFPRQGMDRHPHLFRVMRGAGDQGAAGARCATCHQAQNQTASGVPGALHWRLAPLAMAWEREPGVPMTEAELCRRLLDKTRNGGRNLAQLEAHMDVEPLVRWAWSPGGDAAQQPRAWPPISREAFMRSFRAWTAAGAPCPE